MIGGWEAILLGIVLGVAGGQARLAYLAARSQRATWRRLGLLVAVLPFWPVGCVAYAVGSSRRKGAAGRSPLASRDVDGSSL